MASLPDPDARLAPESISINQLYGEIANALDEAFPRYRPLWVRGEIQSLSDRTGHCYIDLIDPESAGVRNAPVLKVKCWKTQWGTVSGQLRKAGIALEVGMVVTLRGTIDFYQPRAEIAFIAVEVDVTELLGRLAAQRAELIAQLKSEGLFDANRRLPLSPLPMSVALVASPDTEGYRDFLGQLESSGFAFSVKVAKASVQGPTAPRSIARAIAQAGRGEPDLVVVVRGGGSKADLAAFDTAEVARAIATCPVPVWTGIGHTGDESVADLVASAFCITPTACGRELVARVTGWWETKVVQPGQRCVRRCREVLQQVEQRDHQARARLVVSARHQLHASHVRLTGRVEQIATRAPRALDDAHDSLQARRVRLAPAALADLERASDDLANTRRLLDLYDPVRQLERGYTLTLDDAGQAVRSIAHLVAGTTLVTRFADGSATSVVSTTQSQPDRPSGGIDD